MSEGAARDLRTGGRWSPLQRAKNDALWAMACLALAATRPMSAASLRAVGRLVGRAAHALAPGARRTALANVARALPGLGADERRALVRRCFVTLGELLGETVAMLGAPSALPPLRLSDSARVVLEQARAGSRGVVFASAHLGPWERVAASLVAAGVPLVTLARESYDPRFSRLYERIRGGSGVGVVWRSSPGAAARILRTLRRGGVLGMPMDLRARVASCDAPFLGHDAPTAVGPARIALRAGAAVVVGTAAPSGETDSQAGGAGDSAGAGLEITTTQIDSSGLRADDAGARELTARINAELSRRILALPHAWVWMHERWPPQTGV